jgi:hypothetical protein
MNQWMNKLADHYEKTRSAYPRDNLMIVFDIDGTILDMRHMILFVLREFDKLLRTQYFQNLDFHDIDFHEDHVSSMLERLSIPASDRKTILALFEERLISATAFPHSQRPFHGALDVVQWFQKQPNTFVGLNTGRHESLRNNTLDTLNSWGKLHGVVFTDELLYMRSSNNIDSIAYAKAAGINYFKQCGYRTFAFVDNEPDNLMAVSEADCDGEILLLHADTIFKSDVISVPTRAVKGKVYDFTRLVAERRPQTYWDDPNDFDFDNDFRRIA